MREESKSYAREAMDIVEHAAHKIGSRLPGSDGEIKFHQYMGDKLRDIGIEPKTEEFAVSPRSGIGGLSYAGWSGVILSIGAIIALASGFNKLWYALAALGLITIFWLVMSCFFYKTWFDMFFPQEISRNTLGVLEPEDGKYDYTIILYIWQGGLRRGLLFLYCAVFCVYGCREHLRLRRRPVGTDHAGLSGLEHLYVHYELRAYCHRHWFSVCGDVGRSQSSQRFSRRYG